MALSVVRTASHLRFLLAPQDAKHYGNWKIENAELQSRLNRVGILPLPLPFLAGHWGVTLTLQLSMRLRPDSPLPFLNKVEVHTLKRFFKSFWPVTPNAVVAIIASTIVICPFKESTGHLWEKIKQSSSCCDRVGVICFCLLSNHYKSGKPKIRKWPP